MPGAYACATHARAAMGKIVSVRAVDAVVNVVVGVGPEIVTGIRPVNVIKQVVIGVGPEQRSDPADDETAAPSGPPARPKEPPVKSGRRELRSPSRTGDGAAAEYAAAPIGGAGNRERARRAGDKSPAGAREPRPDDTDARRGK